MALMVNRTTAIANTNQTAVSASDATMQHLSTVYELAAGDYVETNVRQNSGGSLNIASSGNLSPEFSMVKIG